MARVAGALAMIILAWAARVSGSGISGWVQPVIFGGAPPHATQFPEVGAIIAASYGQPRSLVCTGTMVSKDIVLTAAHCVVLANGRQLVFARGTNLEDTRKLKVIPIAATYVHPAFVLKPLDASVPMNDIAVVVLARAADGVNPPAWTLSDTQLPTVGSLWSIVGFGPSLVGASDNATVENAAVVSISAVSSTEFTIGLWSGPQPCFGDSGGPAYPATGARAVGGIASRGVVETDAMCEHGTIYTRTDAYSDWIQSVIKEARLRFHEKS